MSTPAKSTTANIIPCLRYRDAPAAIEWLCQAFGFEKKAVYADDGGIIVHAQLTFGNGMIMLSSALNEDSAWGRLVTQPNDIGGLETQSPCIVIADADAMYDSAKAHGAKIAIEIKDEAYGGRGFSCYDLEGHLWNFGTYDPWE